MPVSPFLEVGEVKKNTDDELRDAALWLARQVRDKHDGDLELLSMMLMVTGLKEDPERKGWQDPRNQTRPGNRRKKAKSG